MKKHTRMLLQKRLQGGLSVYVFIMLGMSIILYMFGFTNMMGTGLTGDDGYRTTASSGVGKNGSITNPNLQQDQNPLSLALQAIFNFAKENPIFLIGGIASLIGVAVLGFIAGANMTVLYQYIVPIALIGIFLNYIVFPINPGSDELAHMQLAKGLLVSTALTIFFNLWFVIGMIQYMRTGEI